MCRSTCVYVRVCICSLWDKWPREHGRSNLSDIFLYSLSGEQSLAWV